MPLRRYKAFFGQLINNNRIVGKQSMKKIIRVTGKGQISVPPDRICLLFELEERKDTYREAIKDN